MTAPPLPPRARRVVYVRRGHRGDWLTHFGFPPCDVYDSWAEAIFAATALRRRPGPLPKLPPGELRARLRDEYRHFRYVIGLPHAVVRDRLATVYRTHPDYVTRCVSDLRDAPATTGRAAA